MLMDLVDLVAHSRQLHCRFQNICAPAPMLISFYCIKFTRLTWHMKLEH
jgi:hypothetical protein